MGVAILLWVALRFYNKAADVLDMKIRLSTEAGTVQIYLVQINGPIYFLKRL